MSTIVRAKSIMIGSCGSPECRNVHINFCDADGKVTAAATVHCEELGPIVGDMVACMNKVLSGHAKRGMH